MCKSTCGSTIFVSVCCLLDSNMCDLYPTGLVSCFLPFDPRRKSGAGLFVVTAGMVFEGLPAIGVDALVLS